MYDYQCKIVRVVDGDTVDVDIDLGFNTWRCGERIRLYGVDTPECRTRDDEEKAAGLLAKKFVADCLHIGGSYRLETKGKGKFGRYLGTIKLDDQISINGMLISEGLAVAYHGQNKDLVERQHKENIAKLKEKGLI